MNAKRQSRKALKSLINDAFREALSHLDLPPATKKIKKHIENDAKKIAGVYVELMKKEEKKKRKAEKKIQKALTQSNGRKSSRLTPEERMPEPLKV